MSDLETVDLTSAEAQEVAELLAFVRSKKAQEEQMNTRNPEPVDANVVANPNLHRRQEFPKMVYHHGERSARVVKSQAEHDKLGKGWLEEPFAPEDPEAKKERIQADMAEAQGERIDSLENRMQGIEESQTQILSMLTDLAGKKSKKPADEQK